jgi:hypothetical protein
MNYVREQRPGCIETGTQKDFVLKFSTDLTNLRRVFILPPFLYESFTIHDALARQNNYLHGPERESLSRVPKIVHVLCAELRSRGGISAHELADAFVLSKGWLEQVCVWVCTCACVRARVCVCRCMLSLAVI